MNDGRFIHWSGCLYRGLLRLYPARFRTAFADEMADLFATRLQDAARHGRRAVVGEALRELLDLAGNIIQQIHYERGVHQSMTQHEESAQSDGQHAMRWSTIQWRSLLRETGSTLLLAGAIIIFMNLFVPRYIVEGSSMQPTFTNGDFLLTSPVPYLLDAPQRGDVIVLNTPWQAGQPPLLKRIIGLPGETVSIAGGRVSVDGVPLDEPYINAPPNYTSTWELGADEYFVLGDNRNRSNDSADFGPVKKDLIIGRVLLTYWPPADWGAILRPNYESVPR